MKLYVGNLSFNLSDSELKAKFEEFGTVVSANIITDRDTGRSKGFGFVEMENAASGKEAIDQLNGSEFEGRKVVVNEARPRQERPSNGGGGRSSSHRNGGNRW